MAINKILLESYFRNNYTDDLIIKHNVIVPNRYGKQPKKLETLFHLHTPSYDVKIAVKYIQYPIELDLKIVDDFISLLIEAGIKRGIIFSNLDFPIEWKKKVTLENGLQLKIITERNMDEIKTFFNSFIIDNYNITIFPPNSWIIVSDTPNLKSNNILCILHPEIFELHTAALVKQIMYFKFHNSVPNNSSPRDFLHGQENQIFSEDNNAKVKYYNKKQGNLIVNYRRIVSNQLRFNEISGFVFSKDYLIQCTYILPLKFEEKAIYDIEYIFDELQVHKESI